MNLDPENEDLRAAIAKLNWKRIASDTIQARGAAPELSRAPAADEPRAPLFILLKNAHDQLAAAGWNSNVHGKFSMMTDGAGKFAGITVRGSENVAQIEALVAVENNQAIRRTGGR